jgi:hypothetical protein
MSRTVRTAFALVALLAIASSCNDEPSGPLPSPSSAFPPDTPTPGPFVSGPTASSGAVPASPVDAAGTLERGQVTFSVTGDVEARRTLRTLITAVYTPPPGALAVVWAGGGTDATVVGIGGASFTGTRPTAPTLSLTMTVQTPDGIATFTSIDGECTIEVEVASEREVSGGFVCDDLAAGTGEVVDVRAAFSATG